jgi:hypothetical protein
MHASYNSYCGKVSALQHPRDTNGISPQRIISIRTSICQSRQTSNHISIEYR